MAGSIGDRRGAPCASRVLGVLRNTLKVSEREKGR